MATRISKERSMSSSTYRYRGSKWGVYLRAPDVLFEMLDQYGAALRKLEDFAEVRYGLKSGSDEFFYVRDLSAELEPEELRAAYSRHGLRFSKVSKVALVRNGKGEVHPVERKYLRPIMINFMDVRQIQLGKSDAQAIALCLHEAKGNLKGTHVLGYVQRGEKQKIHKNSTCASREDDPGYAGWYDLVPAAKIAQIMWPKAHQYRHVAFLNPEGLLCKHSIYAIEPRPGVKTEVLGAILNSLVTCFFKELYGKTFGREGMIATGVDDTRNLWVPNLAKIGASAAQELVEIFRSLCGRRIENVADELDREDRKQLDLTVLRLIGVAGVRAKELLGRIYAELRKLHKERRELELIARVNRRKGGGGSGDPYAAVAADIAKEVLDNHGMKFPDDFLPHGPDVEMIELSEGKVVVGTALFSFGRQESGRSRGEIVEVGSIRVGDEEIKLGSRERAEFARLWLEMRGVGVAAIPRDNGVCRQVRLACEKYREGLREKARERVQRVTRAEESQERLMRMVDRLLG